MTVVEIDTGPVPCNAATHVVYERIHQALAYSTYMHDPPRQGGWHMDNIQEHRTNNTKLAAVSASAQSSFATPHQSESCVHDLV